MPPRSYTSIPTEIQAIQWDGNNASDIAEWVGTVNSPSADGPMDGFYASDVNGSAVLYVAANKEWLDLELDEWVAQDQLGFYPIKAEIFAKKYRPTPMETGADMGANVDYAAEFFPQHGGQR